MPRPFRWALEVLFGATCGLLCLGVGTAVSDGWHRYQGIPMEYLAPQSEEKRPAPDFDLLDQGGQRLSLTQLRGKPIVLNFWSMGCPPCIEEMPSLERLTRIGRQRETFSVVTICIHESFEEVAGVFPNGTDLTILFDPDREVTEQRFGTTMFPETYIIDSGGQIRARFDGPRDWSSPAVLSLLETL